jgi:CSLREA domain-containing protein
MRFSPILISAVLYLSATAVHAAVFIVTKTTDSLDGVCAADCSLREAVVAANAAPGKSVIHLQAATYVLTLPAERAWDGESFERMTISTAIWMSPAL